MKENIALWNEILTGGRLVRISVSGDGLTIPLRVPTSGVRPPLLSVWGPRAGEVRNLADRARGLPLKYGLVLFGGSDSARWVPPGNMAALERDFALVSGEMEVLRRECENQWDEIREFCLQRAEELARSIGASPAIAAEWAEQIRKGFPKTPRLSATMVTIVIADPVRIAVEQARLQAARAEQESLAARTAALEAITRQVIHAGEEIRNAISRKFSDLFRAFLEDLDQAIGKGRAEKPKLRSLDRGLLSLADLIDAIGQDVIRQIGDAPAQAILELRASIENLRDTLARADSISQALPQISEALRQMRDAGVFRTYQKYLIVCSRCGTFQAELDREPLRCPRCGSSAVGLPVPE